MELKDCTKTAVIKALEYRMFKADPHRIGKRHKGEDFSLLKALAVRNHIFNGQPYKIYSIDDFTKQVEKATNEILSSVGGELTSSAWEHLNKLKSDGDKSRSVAIVLDDIPKDAAMAAMLCMLDSSLAETILLKEVYFISSDLIAKFL
jgi:hypothetical protein